MDKLLFYHLCIYFIVFIFSYEISLKYKSLICSMICGWSIFGLTTVGHDLLHNPNKKWNKIIAFFCLDLFMFNSSEWIYLHNKIHHPYLKSDKDIMLLKGHNLFEEWYYLIYTHIYGIKNRFINYIYRLPFYYLLYQLDTLQIIILLFSIFNCLAYLTYITHSNPINNGSVKYSIQYDLDNTWDIYPNSDLISLLTGGINAHATHHCYPNAGRSEYSEKSKILEKKYPKNYRKIDNLHDLYKLYSNRFEY